MSIPIIRCWMLIDCWGSHVRKNPLEDLFMMKLLLSPGSGTESTALPTWCWICCRRFSTPPMRPGRASWNCARRSKCRRSPSKLGRDVTMGVQETSCTLTILIEDTMHVGITLVAFGEQTSVSFLKQLLAGLVSFH